MIHFKNRSRNRAGFTLVHQVTIIAVMPVILIAATTWVHESLKMSSRFKQRRESHVLMNQLANQIQDDVRGCKSLQFDPGLSQIQLTGHEDQQITFTIDGSDIKKTLTVDDEVVARESYRFSNEYFAEWDASAMEKDAKRVALNIFRYPTVYRDSAPDSLVVPDPKLELVVTAKANRWDRSIVFGRDAEPASKNGGEE